MKLSIIIVNYNVKYFLEQCLLSVRKAMQGISAEVFVVDNNSVDGSCEMVREKFQEVILIENKINTGFAVANNQAIKQSTGEYILLLNPDTVVEEDTFSKVCAFMDTHANAGGLGVHMIDGKGNFLPESKRGLPTPAVAFYKIFGLSALFPKSKTFGKYHLGYLDKNKTHQVDVLSGAFMLMRKATLDKVGLLDEDFFMYGEDIDLSYRITKGGYKNYYFPETKIIHYKGESTKKSSVNYVLVFYKAMVIFAKKHFSQSNAHTFSVLINIAVYLRAGAAIVARFLDKALLPLLDFLLIFGGFYVLKNYWEINVKQLHYPLIYMRVFVPAYVLVWITGVYFSGGYDRPVQLLKIIRGLATGTIIILVGYALLNEQFRFSRALILIGTLWAMLALILLRFVLSFTGNKKFALANSIKKKTVLVAEPQEAQRILSLLQLAGSNTSFIGLICAQQQLPDELKSYRLGDVSQINEVLNIYEADEVIFSARDFSSQQIISSMLNSNNRNVEYKIAPPESMFIIGSNSINDNGDLYFVDVNALSNPESVRNKRLFDLLACVIMIPLLPVLIFMVKDFLGFIRNWFLVFTGQYSWVSVKLSSQLKNNIKRGVLSPTDAVKDAMPSEDAAQRLNLFYAKEYNWLNDLKILRKGISLAGRSVN
ncbi:MAG TPA: glycosyltransferase [Bacteroidia bacterium]|nr:glycosyltransferase [Bacteroidia bacterium]